MESHVHHGLDQNQHVDFGTEQDGRSHRRRHSMQREQDRVECVETARNVVLHEFGKYVDWKDVNAWFWTWHMRIQRDELAMCGEIGCELRITANFIALRSASN